MNFDFLKTGAGMAAVFGFIFLILFQTPPVELVEKIAGLGAITGIILTVAGVLHG